MSRESRIKKSFKNAKINMVCYILSLLISFVSRKIFIDKLGVDFLGLSSTLSSLLNFLNIVELGVASAISYVLYKPIFEENKDRIQEIISVLGYLYRTIGFIILFAGILLSFFLPLIYPDTLFSWKIIYLGFYTYLFSALLGYFMNYKQSLLYADQKGYEVTGYFQIVSVLKAGIQMGLAWKIRSYSLFFSIEILFGIIYSVILNRRINIVYPWLHTNVRKGKQLLTEYPDIKKYVSQLFVHRIGTFFQYQITPLLIYGFVSLPMVTLFNNYNTITDQIKNFMGGVLNNLNSSVGNLIAEGDIIKIFSIYKNLFSVRFFVSGILCSCLYYLSSEFIGLWLGKQYILSDTIVLLLIIKTFYNMTLSTTADFIFGYGLFSDIWSPIAESAIFLICAVVLGHRYGLSGILMGSIISLTLVIFIWKPYFLFSKGFHLPFYKYWLLFFKNVGLLLVGYWLTVLFNDIIAINVYNMWVKWIIKAFTFLTINTCIDFVLFYYLSDGMRGFMQRIGAYFYNKKTI